MKSKELLHESSSKFVVFTTISIVAIAILGYFYAPVIHDKKDIIEALLTFFSIMTGILLGAISLVGNAVTIVSKSTGQTKELYKKTFIKRLVKLVCIFYLYLATLISLLMDLIDFPGMGKISFSLSVAAIAVSFVLPVYISYIYYDYYTSKN